MRYRTSVDTKSAARIELFARQHRSSLTESEARLWSGLRARQLGVTFRRQIPIAGQFIADFLAPSLRLIVEVDGAYHARRQGADERRDRKLARLGYRIVRVSARLVLTDLAAAVALVRAALLSFAIGAAQRERGWVHVIVVLPARRAVAFGVLKDGRLATVALGVKHVHLSPINRLAGGGGRNRVLGPADPPGDIGQPLASAEPKSVAVVMSRWQYLGPASEQQGVAVPPLLFATRRSVRRCRSATATTAPSTP